MANYNFSGVKRDATPQEIAKYGHIAARLRGLIDSGKWTYATLSRAAGLSQHNGSWAWVNARAAPRESTARALAKAIGCDWQDLRPKKLGDSEPEAPEAESTPVTTAPVPVFSFTVLSDGNARVKLDTTLPLESAKPLIRMLFDAGDLLPKSGESLQSRIGPPSRR
jgi:hypothetical protein